jgi:hypothetical protein
MKLFEKIMLRHNFDKPIIDGYREMRQALQDYGIHEWQLKKGDRIPGTIYNLRAENISRMVVLKNKLNDYGVFDENIDSDDFREYFIEKFKEIDREIPLQNEKPDYLPDEDD